MIKRLDWQNEMFLARKTHPTITHYPALLIVGHIEQAIAAFGINASRHKWRILEMKLKYEILLKEAR